jgi:hypothetical protein
MKYLLQNHFRLLLLSLAPLFFSACGSGENGCGTQTTEAQRYRPRVILAATDTRGNKLTNFVIAYQTNSGSGSKTLTCDSVDGCDLVFFGSGELAITVSKDGYESVSVSASIPAANIICGNYNTESLSVKLKPI